MTVKPTAKALRSDLMYKLINVKGFSRKAAQSVVTGLPQDAVSLQLALDDLNAQDLLNAGNVVQVDRFHDEQRQKVAYNFQIERGRLEALRAIANDDGASVSHHIRQAVADYLKKHAKR